MLKIRIIRNFDRTISEKAGTYEIRGSKKGTEKSVPFMMLDIYLKITHTATGIFLSKFEYS